LAAAQTLGRENSIRIRRRADNFMIRIPNRYVGMGLRHALWVHNLPDEHAAIAERNIVIDGRRRGRQTGRRHGHAHASNRCCDFPEPGASHTNSSHRNDAAPRILHRQVKTENCTLIFGSLALFAMSENLAATPQTAKS
jgi:hypothetical protein